MLADLLELLHGAQCLEVTVPVARVPLCIRELPELVDDLIDVLLELLWTLQDSLGQFFGREADLRQHLAGVVGQPAHGLLGGDHVGDLLGGVFSEGKDLGVDRARGLVHRVLQLALCLGHELRLVCAIFQVGDVRHTDIPGLVLGAGIQSHSFAGFVERVRVLLNGGSEVSARLRPRLCGGASLLRLLGEVAHDHV